MKKEKLITILLPCLNEEKTILDCYNSIKESMNQSKYKNKYDILICDNNSTDQSIKICKENKIHYTVCKEKGYGATLLNGINKAKSKYLVMLDCDGSYDDKDIPKMIDKLEEGYDLVIGNRFKGNIENKAMPISHFFGSRFLTEYANLLFHTKSHDFHCGLRAFRKDKMVECNLETSGFEFASEMIIKAKLNNLKIIELPTNLYKDKRDRKPHLKSIKDGLRHLHTINKIKFQNSHVFRYLTTFLGLLIVFIFFACISAMIPQKSISSNTLKSMKFLNTLYNENTSFKYSPFTFERAGDVRNISMAYHMDNKNIIDTIIRVPYDEKVDIDMNPVNSIKTSNKTLINYSRYWQGQAFYSKLALVFIPVGYLFYSINAFILLVLLSYITIKLWKIDKKISIAFLISNLMINALFCGFSTQFFFAILLSYIFIILMIKMYQRNSKNIDILFLMSGMITCFFDFLTCETITLTIPLALLVMFRIKDNNPMKIKEIIKYIMIWFIAYASTFGIKWLIDCLYFGFDYFKVILDKMFIRIDDNSIPMYLMPIKAVLRGFEDILPFAFLENGMIICTIIMLIMIYYNLFENRKYISLLFISLVPIGRFILLATHSYKFHYFTYRALEPLAFLMIISILEIGSKILTKKSN